MLSSYLSPIYSPANPSLSVNAAARANIDFEMLFGYISGSIDNLNFFSPHVEIEAVRAELNDEGVSLPSIAPWQVGLLPVYQLTARMLEMIRIHTGKYQFIRYMRKYYNQATRRLPVAFHTSPINLYLAKHHLKNVIYQTYIAVFHAMAPRNIPTSIKLVEMLGALTSVLNKERWWKQYLFLDTSSLFSRNFVVAQTQRMIGITRWVDETPPIEKKDLMKWMLRPNALGWRDNGLGWRDNGLGWGEDWIRHNCAFNTYLSTLKFHTFGQKYISHWTHPENKSWIHQVMPEFIINSITLFPLSKDFRTDAEWKQALGDFNVGALDLQEGDILSVYAGPFPPTVLNYQKSVTQVHADSYQFKCNFIKSLESNFLHEVIVSDVEVASYTKHLRDIYCLSLWSPGTFSRYASFDSVSSPVDSGGYEHLEEIPVNHAIGESSLFQEEVSGLRIKSNAFSDRFNVVAGVYGSHPFYRRAL